MPDVQRIWDSLLADPRRFQFLLYICTALVIEVKDDLEDHDFSDNISFFLIKINILNKCN